MKVFKFGGASVKDAVAVRNVGEILKKYEGEPITVVVSAMGKITNALEKLAGSYYHGKKDTQKHYAEIKDFHADILSELFKNPNHEVHTEINNIFVEIDWILEDAPAGSFDFIYDQIVSMGEMLSTKIVSSYLNETGITNRWVDVRDLIRTDNTYREGKVNWELTGAQILNHLKNNPESAQKVTVTQGFVGGTSENYTTTLGREGSDYTAAIIGYFLDAEEVTIWKDVAGILNADPRYFEQTKKLDHISYLEAIELAYYGAKVIHPKTIKPLQNKNIPLLVRSFADFAGKGTVINKNSGSDSLIPSFIFKMNQVLISVSARDFSFIVEENLSDIYGSFARHGVKINLMQNSAVSFSVSVDNDSGKVPELLKELEKKYKLLYNDNLELLTVRHYDQATIDLLTKNKEILVDQRSRHTARMVLREKNG